MRNENFPISLFKKSIFIPIRGVKNSVQKIGEHAIKRTSIDTPVTSAGISGTSSAPIQGNGNVVNAEKPENVDYKNVQPQGKTAFFNKPSNPAEQDTKEIATPSFQTTETLDVKKDGITPEYSSSELQTLALLISGTKQVKTWNPKFLVVSNETQVHLYDSVNGKHYVISRPIHEIQGSKKFETDMNLAMTCTSSKGFSETYNNNPKPKFCKTFIGSYQKNLAGSKTPQRIHGPVLMNSDEFTDRILIEDLDPVAFAEIDALLEAETERFNTAEFQSFQEAMATFNLLMRTPY